MKYTSPGRGLPSIILVIAVLTTVVSGKLPWLTSVQAATLQSVTVTSTQTGTLQTQLSTNSVWSGAVDGAPSGQAKLNALRAPLIRLHVGDDGWQQALPEIQQGKWANPGSSIHQAESRPFENLDLLVNNVFTAGQQPLMNIKFAPDWMWTCYPNSIGVSSSQSQGVGSVADATFQQYAQYMARIVSYYNRGSMTTETGAVVTNPVGTSHRITWWELWNEPDLNNETPCAPATGNGLTYQQYVTMWNAVTAAMLAVDPSLKFVGPATAGSQFGSSTATGNQYVDSLMANATVKPSALSFHGYGYWDNSVTDQWLFDGDNSEPAAQCCGGVVDLLGGVKRVRSAYPSLPVWLTEVNVNADWGSDANKRPWSELAAAWWGTMFATVAPQGAGLIHQYDLADDPQFGLFDPSTDKTYMAYYVFQLLNQAFPQGSALLGSTSSQANIVTLAARKPDGTISVMLVNRQLASSTVKSGCGTGGVATDVTLTLQGISAGSATVQQLDKTNVNCSTNAASPPTVRSVDPSQGITVSFPGYGLAVVSIAPGQGTVPSATPTQTSTTGTATATATSTAVPATATATKTALPATATPTSTSAPATAAPACTPSVGMTSSVLEMEGGVPVALSVVVPADRSRNPANALSKIRYSGTVNAVVELADTGEPSPSTVTFSTPVPSWTFILRKVNATGGFQTSFTATDTCGAVTKFVGMGPASPTGTLFSDGFEGGALPGAWSTTRVTTGNSLTLDSAVEHGGNASLKAVQVKGQVGSAYVSKSIAGQSTVDVRGYYHLSNPIQWGAVQLMSLYAQGTFVGWVTYNVDPSSPTLTVYNGANNRFYSCSVPSLNAWHSLELQYVLSTTTGGFTLWLDGAKACGATGIKTSAQSGKTIDQVVVGVDSADKTGGLTVRMDDVIISTGYIGP